MMDVVYETGQQLINNTLYVRFSNGTVKSFDAVKLGCEWFTMSNDTFYMLYGFNFNPHKWGLYDHCRKLVHGKYA